MSSLRWLVHTTSWQPSDALFQFLLGHISEAESSDVRMFKRYEDQKRCLVSRLLQRQCISILCGVPFTQVQIRRQKGNKPYSAHPRPATAPNFNFNVTHEVSRSSLSWPECLWGGGWPGPAGWAECLGCVDHSPVLHRRPPPLPLPLPAGGLHSAGL